MVDLQASELGELVVLSWAVFARNVGRNWLNLSVLLYQIETYSLSVLLSFCATDEPRARYGGYKCGGGF